MDKYKFGEFIYNKRKSLGLTQDELGRKLGVTNKAVSKWETGETLPDVQILEMLAGALNVTIDELLTQKAPEVQIQYIEPKKSIFKHIAFIIIGVLLVIILALAITFIPKEKSISTVNALRYYVINPCDDVNVNGDEITINGSVKKSASILDAKLRLAITVQYYYKTDSDGVGEILYLDRLVEVNEENMSFSLTLSPKNEISNFKEFYGFDISYKLIEVNGKFA